MSQVNDCEYDALISQGYSGSISNMRKSWEVDNNIPNEHVFYTVLKDLGYDGAFPTMERDFWCAGGNIGTPATFELFFPLTSNLAGLIDEGVETGATFARAAGVSTVEDFEGVIHPCRDGEARFWKSRRVENVIAGDIFDDGLDWIMGGDATLVEFTSEGNTALRFHSTIGGASHSALSPIAKTIYPGDLVGTTIGAQMEIRAAAPANIGDIINVLFMSSNFASQVPVNVALTDNWEVIPFQGQNHTDGSNLVVALQSVLVGKEVEFEVRKIMGEKLSVTQTAYSEYIQYDVDYGANVVGVKYFNTDREGVRLTDMRGCLVEEGDLAYDPASGVQGTTQSETLSIPRPAILNAPDANGFIFSFKNYTLSDGANAKDTFNATFSGDGGDSIDFVNDATGIYSVVRTGQILNITGDNLSKERAQSVQVSSSEGTTFTMNSVPVVDPITTDVDLVSASPLIHIGSDNVGGQQANAGFKNVIVIDT